MPATSVQQQQGILRALGYDGWHVVSVVPEIKKVAADPNALPGSPEATGGEQPTGNEQWTIADGKGHNETMVVKPAAAPAGPYENQDDPGASQSTPQVVTPPKNLPAADTTVRNTQTYTAPDGTLYEKSPTTGKWDFARDANGNPLPPGAKPSTRTPAEEAASQASANRTTALTQPEVDEMVARGLLSRVQAAAVVGKMPSEIAEIGARTGLTQAQITALQAKTPAEIAELNARTASSAASAAATTARTPAEIAELSARAAASTAAASATAARTPAEIAELQSRAAQGDALAQKTLQDIALARLPKYGEATPTSGPYQTVTDPVTGKQTLQPNANYKPTDVGSQITQLQQKAQAFHDDLTSKVQAGTLDADKAQQQWDDYWRTEVAPQQQAIGAAQEQQRFTNQITASNAQASRDQYALSAQRDAQTFAQTAGNEAVKSVMDTLPYRVGPQMGADFAKGLNTLSSGGGAVNFSPSDFTFDMPDMESIRHQAVANALKDVSPYAASQVGAPIPQVPQGLDLNSLLNQSSYGGGFAPTAPASPAAPTTTIAPDGTITVQHVAPGGANGGVDTSGADMQYAVPAQLPPASNPWSGNVDLSQLD